MQLTLAGKTMIQKSLRTFFPKAAIYVFGSRVRGDAKRYSDLDIAIDEGAPIDFTKMAQVKEFFANSDLVFQVDISDFQKMDAAFQKHVLEQKVEF